MEKITARGNEKIKYAVSLARSSSKRRESGEFFLEGARLCADAAESGVCVVTAFFTAAALETYSSYISKITAVCSSCYEVGSDAAARLSDTDSSQGVFCVCKAADFSPSLDLSGRYIALENVQDPSNLGAVCRTAEALGLGLIVSGGCDIYNPKALRAAMGSSLRLGIITVEDLPSFISDARGKGMLTLASTPRSDACVLGSFPVGSGVICVVGNEGNGVTEKTMLACERAVTIPMAGRAESLNASAAAAILMWEIARKD